MSRFLRQDLANIKSYKTGKSQYNVKLDANESFLNLSEDIQKKIHDLINNASFNRYPDAESSTVCQLYARYAGVKPEKIIAGNGSDEIISLIFDSFIDVNDSVMTIIPDFSMYDFYAAKSRANIIKFSTNNDFSLDVNKLTEEINKAKCKIFIFSNPNNPSGKTISSYEIKKILQECSCLVVVDEAYFEFNDETALELINGYDNLLILRTCSKAFGIPSLRLGFALGSEELIQDMKKIKAPFNISFLTQKIGEIILNNTTYVNNNIQCILKERQLFFEKLKEVNTIQVLPSKANYFLIKPKNSKEMFSKLIENDVLVRKFSEERMKDFLRITVGSRNENNKVISILNKFF